MKVSVPTIVALATTGAPNAVRGLNLGRAYTPMLMQLSPASVLLERQRSLAQRMFDQTGFSSPRYELLDDDDKFQLSVDVPGVKEEDIDIQLDDGFLTVKGQRMASTESSRFSSRFSQTFSLDPSVDVEKFSAYLNNGVLTISAPKDMKKLEESIRRIPITAGAPPMEEMAPPSLEATSDSKDNQKVQIPVKEHHVEAQAKEENDEEEIDLDA
jgi:HSP20 family protein